MGAVEKHVLRYVFPVQFIFGIVGNLLNLLVLNHKGMRTKTNLFLSGMALADLLFFLALLPSNLHVYDHIWRLPMYRAFFFHYSYKFVGLANWFSAASIWLTVGVTVERLAAVRLPFSVKSRQKRGHVWVTVSVIFAITLILASYNFVWHITEEDLLPCHHLKMSCVPTIQYTIREVTKADGPGLYYYVQISQVVYAGGVILLPLSLLVICNVILIVHLKHNNQNVSQFTKNINIIRRSERKATLLVVVILVSFLISNGPSAVMMTWHVVNSIKDISPPHWYTICVELSNALVTTGKAINFILYCIASTTFRAKLRRVLSNCIRCNKRRQWDSQHTHTVSSRRATSSQQDLLDGGQRVQGSPAPGGESGHARAMVDWRWHSRDRQQRRQHGDQSHVRFLSGGSGVKGPRANARAREWARRTRSLEGRIVSEPEK